MTKSTMQILTLSLLLLTPSLWAADKMQPAANAICTSEDDGWTVTMLWPSPNLKRFYEYTLTAVHDKETATWGYHLSKGPRSEPLSYWLLEIPDCQSSITGITPGVTWQTTKGFEGVRRKQEGTLTMTLNQPEPVGTREFLVKSTRYYATCEIKAPQCTARCKHGECKKGK